MYGVAKDVKFLQSLTVTMSHSTKLKRKMVALLCLVLSKSSSCEPTIWCTSVKVFDSEFRKPYLCKHMSCKIVNYLRTYAHHPSRAWRKLFVLVRFMVFRTELKTLKKVLFRKFKFNIGTSTEKLIPKIVQKNTFLTRAYIQRKLVLYTYNLPRRCVSLIPTGSSSLASIWHCSYGAETFAKFQRLLHQKPLTQMSL